MMALPVVTALLAASAPLNQVDTTAGLRGRAASSFNGRPLAGVMISVPAAHKFIVTDSTGAFWIAGLPPGGQIVRIAYEGRETEEYEFFLRSAHTKTIAVLLDVDAVNLDPLVVEARQANTWRDLAGFYERKRWYGGFARVFTRGEIDRIQPKKTGTALALAGIVPRADAVRRGAFVRRAGQRERSAVGRGHLRPHPDHERRGDRDLPWRAAVRAQSVLGGDAGLVGLDGRRVSESKSVRAGADLDAMSLRL